MFIFKIIKTGDVELKVVFVSPDEDSDIDNNSDFNYPFLEDDEDRDKEQQSLISKSNNDTISNTVSIDGTK
jgi:hypothetical protein